MRSVIVVTLLGLVGSDCRQPQPAAAVETTVSAADYAFQVPRHFSQGRAVFRLRNTGRVPHEMALGQLRPGMTADSVLARVASGKDPAELTDGVVGILIAGPGTSSLGTLSADLIRGRTYMMICQFRDADSLPPHLAMGMQASFLVD